MQNWVVFLLLAFIANITKIDPSAVTQLCTLSIPTIDWDTSGRVIQVVLLVYVLRIAHPMLRRFSTCRMSPWAEQLLAFLFCLFVLAIVIHDQYVFSQTWVHAGS